jgi:hypothetical protein
MHATCADSTARCTDGALSLGFSGWPCHATCHADDVQFGAKVGGGDPFKEAQELLVAVAWVAGVGHLAGGHFQSGEQGGDALPGVVLCLPS